MSGPVDFYERRRNRIALREPPQTRRRHGVDPREATLQSLEVGDAVNPQGGNRAPRLQDVASGTPGVSSRRARYRRDPTTMSTRPRPGKIGETKYRFNRAVKRVSFQTLSFLFTHISSYNHQMLAGRV